jgi:hypothetical protein
VQGRTVDSRTIVLVAVLALLAAALGAYCGGLWPRRELDRGAAVSDGVLSSSSKSEIDRPTAPYTSRIRSMVASLELSEAEKAAVDSTVAEKTAAREALYRQAFALFQLAIDAEVSEERLAEAIGSYHAAKHDFERRIGEIDADLAGKLSPRSRARLLSTGILDNGLGFMAGSPLPAARPADSGSSGRRGSQR